MSKSRTINDKVAMVVKNLFDGLHYVMVGNPVTPWTWCIEGGSRHSLEEAMEAADAINAKDRRFAIVDTGSGIVKVYSGGKTTLGNGDEAPEDIKREAWQFLNGLTAVRG
ncbi:MAG TPA: hypothetical protein PKJ19_08115 [Flavobacteriales bacterium]|nr:hypothetical protein [Flavobacteriales bacterium]